MSGDHVFVYGTLRAGGSNHFRMAGAVLLGKGWLAGRMHRIDWYPALVCGGGGKVRGEIYLIRLNHLIELDAFEGITPDAVEPREYRRVKVEVNLDNGEVVEAWVWEWAGSLDEAPELEGDDWLDFEPNPG